MAAQLFFFENSSLASPSAWPVHQAFWPSSAHYTFSSSPGPKTLHGPSWPASLRSPLRPTQGSSPTSVAQATFGLAGATAPLAAVGHPPVRVRSRSDAPPSCILFPYTNSMPCRLPSPYYSLKSAELSSTEPPLVTPQPPPLPSSPAL
jgi:hypothetical protein